MNPTVAAPVAAGSTELLTMGQVCDWLHVSKMTIHRWRHGEGAEGFPPPIRVGGGIRFLRRDVEGWIASRPAA